MQHRQISLREDDGLLSAHLHGQGADPMGEGFGEDVATPVPVGACILIGRELFERVGGFTHGYLYGGEDIDLGLKAMEQGAEIVCSGRSLLLHRLGATRARESAERQPARERGNRRMVLERWGPRIRREYELDRLDGGGFWAAPGEPAERPPSREEALALGFCLRSSEPARPAGDPLEELAAELGRRGHRHALLREERIDDLVGFNHDVAVHLRGGSRYVPRPSQLNVLWEAGGAEPAGEAERRRYDLVVSGGSPAELIAAALARAEEARRPTRIAQPGS